MSLESGLSRSARAKCSPTSSDQRYWSSTYTRRSAWAIALVLPSITDRSPSGAKSYALG